MFKVEAFKKLYLQHMETFSQGIFQPERFIKQVDQIASAIRPSVAEESSGRLARFEAAVAGKPVEQTQMGPPPRPGATQPATQPNNPGPPRGPFGALNPIKLFAPLRSKSVIEQLSGKSDGLTSTTCPARPAFAGKNAFAPAFPCAGGDEGIRQRQGPGNHLAEAPLVLPVFDS